MKKIIIYIVITISCSLMIFSQDYGPKQAKVYTFTNDSILYYINLPTLNGENLTMNLPYEEKQDSIYDTYY